MKSLLALLLLLASTEIRAADFSKGVGVGMIVGEPTGISLKWFLDLRSSVVFGGSYSWNQFVTLHADYLWHFDHFVSKNRFLARMRPYIGAGVAEVFSTITRTAAFGSTGFGARVPVGLAWIYDTAPFEAFVEVAPGFIFTPQSYFFVQGGIGARILF